MKTEQELKIMAETMAETITIRTMENGNSHDTTRTSTDGEKNILKNILSGALLTINFGTDYAGKKQAILDMAEFTTMQFLPNANCYDSVYCKLQLAII